MAALTWSKCLWFLSRDASAQQSMGQQSFSSPLKELALAPREGSVWPGCQ